MNLNREQSQAVNCIKKSVFVTAGPGSGKTRVLTQRIVNLIGNGASPTEILGFTFTRNAATQMRERLEADLGEDVAKKLTITTIHGFCMRVLGTWGHLVSLKDGFSVYDDQDQLDIIKTVQADLGIKTKPQTLLREINTGKPSPKRVLAMQEFYYRLKQNNAINFRGLLDKAIYILSSHADALDHYAHRYRYVHLDEMNDTSDEDYALVRMIAGKHKNLMAVGDLDQCIYTFRGSNVQNIQHLMIDFPDHDEVVLSRSYRCTVPVCGACNELISKNLTSSGKKLITDKKGHPVVLREYDTEDEEARAIAETIKVQVENGAKYEDFAVLCRIHAIEDGILSALNSQKIPVSVAGTTLRFLDLEEVRTFHHYLMLFANARDDFAFEKVMNTPNREVRNSTKAKIRAIARQGDLSMLEAALIHFSKEPEKGDWLVQLRDISKMDFPNMLRAVYDLLHQWYDSQGLTTRAENLTRVLSFGSVWMLETPDTISVENYLSYVGGVNQQDDVTTDENTVKLMTVHASKGLEFPVVIMPACENLIFPMNNKADTPEKVEGLEEERRLFYVGMSRSMMNLIVTHARRRVFRGKDRDMEPSVFIGEAGLTEKGQVQYAP